MVDVQPPLATLARALALSDELPKATVLAGRIALCLRDIAGTTVDFAAVTVTTSPISRSGRSLSSAVDFCADLLDDAYSGRPFRGGQL
ncbi:MULTISPECIES: hypothetical protein [unclassified Frankia]|uniref:hypothetical protein n=1 Tax=unclassified Frankia TaxID=2632575 RepID=UPI001EF71BA0|nr:MULTISPECIES: hypothetical protein [unclassified Frankia]